ncbi:unnamed protein product, partial [Mesorhabditis spiculigera]
MTLSRDPEFQNLVAHVKANEEGKLKISEEFEKDPKRFETFSRLLTTPDGAILFDFSKHRITVKTLELLLKVAESRKVTAMRDAMFNGERINFTEDRAVLHIALRNRENRPIMVDGKDVMPAVKAVLAHMSEFCEQIISGQWLGYTGKKITDVVNIGIGGSDLGPLMVTEALKHYQVGPNVHFVSNIDGTHIAEVLKKLDPRNDPFHHRFEDLHHAGNYHEC